eukprot:Hpha_TRINITY_DN15726_c0_g3::TRINITY_DN15726_c0_g3_i1::g.40208::m.40208/K11855/USP36_42; ubiquitin carboxyl-terminal hydrolase 36/42
MAAGYLSPTHYPSPLRSPCSPGNGSCRTWRQNAVHVPETRSPPLSLPVEHHPPVASDPTQPKDGRVLSEDHEFTELMRRPAEWGTPRGLMNLGNTCYLNSALQCLFRTTPLQRFLRKHSPSGMSWASVVHQLSREAHDNTRCRGAFAPRLLAERVSQLGQRFRLGRQEDAQEFVNYLLEAIHDAQLAELGRGKKEDPLVAATTPVRRICGGFLRSRVEWRKEEEFRSWGQPDAKPTAKHFNRAGATTSDSFDVFTALSLELTGLPVNSLISALQQFTAVEQLDSDNRYRTPQGALVCATKRLTVCRPPRILVVHLKRFVTDIFGGNPKKLSQHIDFSERLDFRPFCSFQGDHQYRLYGVVVHQGYSLAFGHYYAYVRSCDGKWFCCDDSNVSEVRFDQVRKDHAYLLFYERLGAMPPAATGTGQEESEPDMAEAPPLTRPTPVPRTQIPCQTFVAAALAAVISSAPCEDGGAGDAVVRNLVSQMLHADSPHPFPRLYPLPEGGELQRVEGSEACAANCVAGEMSIDGCVSRLEALMYECRAKGDCTEQVVSLLSRTLEDAGDLRDLVGGVLCPPPTKPPAPSHHPPKPTPAPSQRPPAPKRRRICPTTM